MSPSDILTPMPDDQLGRLAMIEAIRAQTDILKGFQKSVDAQDHKLDRIGDQLGEMKTDIALLKNSTVKADVDDLKARIKVLEDLSSRQRGERGVIAAIFNSKGLAWVIAIASGFAAWMKGAFH